MGNTHITYGYDFILVSKNMTAFNYLPIKEELFYQAVTTYHLFHQETHITRQNEKEIFQMRFENLNEPQARKKLFPQPKMLMFIFFSRDIRSNWN